MNGYRFTKLDPEAKKLWESYEQLKKLFNYLLLKTHGDAEDAFEWMKNLQTKGYIDSKVDLEKFLEKLKAEGLVNEKKSGALNLSQKGAKEMRKASLRWIFQNMKPQGREGAHTTERGGGQSEDLPELKEYQYGDEWTKVDYNQSLLNQVRRSGSLEEDLAQDDLVVHDSKRSTGCATVLLLDISHSMILYGEDRFTPAKQVALALTELILTQYKGDALDVVLFGDEAKPVPIRELPFASVGPYHTNTKAGLAAARKILEQRPQGNKQILMVTDGKPTVIHVPGEGIYRNTFGMDDRIINRTLDEAVICRRKGIGITTFMVTRDPWLEQFVDRLTELNQGRAYFSRPDQVGGFVMKDFVQNRKRNA